ncbi:MAG TPA: type II toxin-antitoxin system VapC family toxin [Iamia sp.]
MRCLADTHVALWVLAGDPQLGRGAIAALRASEGGAIVSAVSVWEIAIKVAAGRLDAPDDVPAALEASGFTLIDITPRHGVSAGHLPLHHKDPFDRMLVAQAQVEGLALVTADAAMAAYDVELIDARR